jgi:hypothetical protein
MVNEDWNRLATLQEPIAIVHGPRDSNSGSGESRRCPAWRGVLLPDAAVMLAPESDGPPCSGQSSSVCRCNARPRARSVTGQVCSRPQASTGGLPPLAAIAVPPLRAIGSRNRRCPGSRGFRGSRRSPVAPGNSSARRDRSYHNKLTSNDFLVTWAVQGPWLAACRRVSN